LIEPPFLEMEVAMVYLLYLPLIGRFDLPEFNDALLKAKVAFERGLRVDRLELPDGSRLGPSEIWKLVQERRAVLAGWRRLT
jgi:hypothetical protein